MNLYIDLDQLKTRLVSHGPEQSTEPRWYVIRMLGGVGGENREIPPYPDYVNTTNHIVAFFRVIKIQINLLHHCTKQWTYDTNTKTILRFRYFQYKISHRAELNQRNKPLVC